MRRKPGSLLPLEVSILDAGLDLHGQGVQGFHGFLLASHVAERDQARLLTAHGTLYRALGRMEQAGLLTSWWEAPELALAEGRPRRRLYRVTIPGAQALAQARVEAPRGATDRAPGRATG